MKNDLRKMLRDGNDMKYIDFKIIKNLAEIITKQIGENYFQTYDTAVTVVSKIPKIEFKKIKNKQNRKIFSKFIFSN